MPSSRVLVVANKWWECVPMLDALLHDEVTDGKGGLLPWPVELHHPRFLGNSPRPDHAGMMLGKDPKKPSPADRPPLLEDPAPKPRAIFQLVNCSVEVWCISDLMEHLAVTPDVQSSSGVKKQYLPKIGFSNASLVIAMGTAAYPRQENENGSVVIGSDIFMHDCHPTGHPNTHSGWHDGPFDELIESTITEERFRSITDIEKGSTVRDRFLVPPLNPATYGRIIARRDYVALGAVNVTDYTEYSRTDEATLDAFLRAGYDIRLARSLETTHGLIRTELGKEAGSAAAPFIWVSGITDRVGYFDVEVSRRAHPQNFTASRNAGVAIAALLLKYDADLTKEAENKKKEQAASLA